MSQFKACVSSIETCENLHIVHFSVAGHTLFMMSLELPENIVINDAVLITVKPTNIAIGKECQGQLSYANQLPCTVKSIENGKLLSSIGLEFCGVELESLITVSSSLQMDLQLGEKVTVFIQASDLSIAEYL